MSSKHDSPACFHKTDDTCDLFSFFPIFCCFTIVIFFHQSKSLSITRVSVDFSRSSASRTSPSKTHRDTLSFFRTLSKPFSLFPFLSPFFLALTRIQIARSNVRHACVTARRSETQRVQKFGLAYNQTFRHPLHFTVHQLRPTYSTIVGYTSRQGDSNERINFRSNSVQADLETGCQKM